MLQRPKRRRRLQQRLLMPLNKLIKKSELLALTLLLLILTGCSSRQIVLYPIQQTDFYVVDGGDRDGDVCMSEFYFSEVLQAKIKELTDKLNSAGSVFVVP